MKYYAVRIGHDGPKVYTSWDECSKAVKGCKGADFKSFSTEEDAKLYLNYKPYVLDVYPVGHHITVDASSSIKENFWEFQMVWSDTHEVIYRSPTYKDGTNNTGEVMGLAYAAIYRAKNKLNCNIYTDSKTAISALSKGHYNMKSELISLETRKMLEDIIIEAMQVDTNKIIHWNNGLIGTEIPADFGRK